MGGLANKEAPPTVGSEATARQRRRIPRVVAWLAVGIVLANAGFLGVVAWLSGTDLVQRLATEGRGVIATELLSSGDVLVATSANEVQLVRDGEVGATAQIDGTVRDLAAADEGYLVASTAGVHLLDGELREVALAQIPAGSAVAVENSDAGVVVAHGIGQNSVQYWVSVLPSLEPGQDGAVEPLASYEAPFDIAGLSVSGGVAYYGTVAAHVGAVDLATGEARWEAWAPHEVRDVLAVPGGVLAGDSNGGLTRFRDDGATEGTVTTQNYRVTALAQDPDTGRILVGDFSGRVHIFNQDGNLELTQRFGERQIIGLHTLPDNGVLVIPRDGTWALLDLTAVGTVTTRGLVVTAWVLANVVALATMTVTLVAVSARRRSRALALATAMWKGRQGYLFIALAAVAVAYFFYVPTGMAVWQSFTNFSLRSTTEWVGLENYRQAFADPYVRTGITNMVIIVVASFLKTVTVPLLAAELVYWLRNNTHSYFFRTAFVWASIPPGIVTILLWRMIYDPYDGLINNTLEAMGLEGLTRAWLGDADTALGAVIFMGFPWLSVFAFLIFLGGLLNINRELYDSAAIDGVNLWQRFRYIDVVHLLPQFRILVFLAITGSIETFAGIFILTRGGPGYATYVPALQMYYKIGEGELGYAATIGVLLSLLSLVVAWVILRFRRQQVDEIAE